MQKPEEVRMVKRLHIGNKWMLGKVCQVTRTGHKKELVIVKYGECNYRQFRVQYIG